MVESFEILENVHRMATLNKSFKDILAFNIQHDEYFFLNHVATFSLKVQYVTKEAKKNKSFPTLPKIK